MMKLRKYIVPVLLSFVIALSSLSVGAASKNAIKLKGNEKIFPKDDVKISVVVDADAVKGVSGTLSYDYSLLTYKSISIDAKGWKVKVNPVENLIYFAGVDASNSNALKSGKTVFTFIFSSEFALLNDKIEVKASDLKITTGKSVISANDASFSGIITDEIEEEYEVVEEIYEAPASDDDDVIVSDEETENGDPYDDIRLASLSVKGKKLSPDFDPDVKSYKISVNENEKKIKVKAVPKNPDSKVTISGEKLSNEKTSLTTVTVKAENGSKRVYKIYSVRKQSVSANTEGGIPFYVWIIAGVVIAAIITGVIIIVVKRKKKSK